jgi:Polysaccharide pyruvyl transferase
MKKTATLTFQNADNYGAILQAYALHKTLANIGVENHVLNYQSKYMGKPYGLAALKRKGIIRFLLGIAYYIVRMPRKAKFSELRTHLKMTPILNKSDLINLEEQYDCFIAGSDQVWNDSITDLDPSFFLDFVKSPDKKLSYAASFGFESMPNDLKIKYKELLKDFSSYNMREASGVEIINSLLKKPANLVLDPTLLLTREEWNTIENAPAIKEKYILVYQVTLSSFLIKTVKKIAKFTGYKVVTVPFPLGGFLKAKTNLSAGPREWIGLIRDAEIVVTDSFHGCCFSILYNKKFYVCITGAATRIYNLLNVFNLNECLYKPGSQLELTNKIDWEKINSSLGEERKRSINILKYMLKI